MLLLGVLPYWIDSGSAIVVLIIPPTPLPAGMLPQPLVHSLPLVEGVALELNVAIFIVPIEHTNTINPAGTRIKISNKLLL